MPDEPWDAYTRAPLRSGWSYPVGRSSVEAALRAGGVHLVQLWFSATVDGPADPLLLRAERFADTAATYDLPRGTPLRSRCTLTVHAVPSADRARAHTALMASGGLERACAWLAAIDAAAPTLRDTGHTWTASLHGTGLAIDTTCRHDRP